MRGDSFLADDSSSDRKEHHTVARKRKYSRSGGKRRGLGCWGGGVKFTHDASCRWQKIGWRKKLDASRMYPRILRRSRMPKCARALHMSQMQLSSMHSLAAKSACSGGFSPKASAAALQEHENSITACPMSPLGRERGGALDRSCLGGDEGVDIVDARPSLRRKVWVLNTAPHES